MSELVGSRLEYAPGATDDRLEQEAHAPDPEQDEEFDPLIHDGGLALSLGIDYLWSEHAAYSEQVRSGEYFDYAKLTANKCRIALDAFDYLTSVIGLDVDEVFRRWCEVPTIFMPTAVSNKYGGDKGSLNDLLDNAVRAYVCGAPAAAIAMCRAILEMIIRNHYLADPQELYYTDHAGNRREKGLGDLIVLAERKYESLRRLRLTNLKDAGDHILHRYHRNEPMRHEDEKQIVQFMRALKTLIQTAVK